MSIQSLFIKESSNATYSINKKLSDQVIAKIVELYDGIALDDETMRKIADIIDNASKNFENVATLDHAEGIIGRLEFESGLGEERHKELIELISSVGVSEDKMREMVGEALTTNSRANLQIADHIINEVVDRIIKVHGDITKLQSSQEENIRKTIRPENFYLGAEFTGKLARKSVKGGVILEETTFKIKED